MRCTLGEATAWPPGAEGGACSVGQAGQETGKRAHCQSAPRKSGNSMGKPETQLWKNGRG